MGITAALRSSSWTRTFASPGDLNLWNFVSHCKLIETWVLIRTLGDVEKKDTNDKSVKHGGVFYHKCAIWEIFKAPTGGNSGSPLPKPPVAKLL